MTTYTATNGSAFYLDAPTDAPPTPAEEETFPPDVEPHDCSIEEHVEEHGSLYHSGAFEVVVRCAVEGCPTIFSRYMDSVL